MASCETCVLWHSNDRRPAFKSTSVNVGHDERRAGADDAACRLFVEQAAAQFAAKQ
jgi:hypothetical protein